MTKKCTGCKQEKAKDEFHKNATTKDGLQNECKTCGSTRVKARYERNVRTNPRKPYINQTRPSVHDGAIEVKLVGSSDLWTILDLEDFERFHDYKFYLNAGYAAIYPEAKYVRLHKLIVDYPIVDHINQDKFDNRKCNLRSVTKSQNNMNRLKQSNNTSGFRGVSWDKQKQKWHAQIKINGRQKYLGYFVDILDAARAYDKAATELLSEYAVLNFPLEQIL